MDSSGRLYSQVAAEAGVSPERAMVACYLADLSRAGRSMNEAASLLRKERGEVRDYARDWGISFSDYRRAAKPMELTWRKANLGWELVGPGGAKIADSLSAVENGTRRCYAQLIDLPGGEVCDGSSHDVAIRRLSLQIDRRSLDLFGVDDITICVVRDGISEQVAPKMADEPAKLQAALAPASHLPSMSEDRSDG